jgi:hypothetical protein
MNTIFKGFMYYVLIVIVTEIIATISGIVIMPILFEAIRQYMEQTGLVFQNGMIPQYIGALMIIWCFLLGVFGIIMLCFSRFVYTKFGKTSAMFYVGFWGSFLTYPIIAAGMLSHILHILFEGMM